MSRIRSVHPGLWTDERFVSASPMARLLFMGIWNECDDVGSFEWSPLKLKMRILPADAADASALLTELVEAGSVLKYEIDGKAYGAVRNFCQYQRPKKPTSTYPQTDEVRTWVNTDARSVRDGSEPVPNELPTASEIPRQMEDGGGNKEASSDEEASLSANDDEKVELRPEHVVEAWNTTARRLGLPVVKTLTRERQQKLEARIRENTIEDFTEAISAIEHSPFLRGEGPRGWKADFDFLLSKSKFTRLIEGSYAH